MSAVMDRLHKLDEILEDTEYARQQLIELKMIVEADRLSAVMDEIDCERDYIIETELPDAAEVRALVGLNHNF